MRRSEDAARVIQRKFRKRKYDFGDVVVEAMNMKSGKDNDNDNDDHSTEATDEQDDPDEEPRDYSAIYGFFIVIMFTLGMMATKLCNSCTKMFSNEGDDDVGGVVNQAVTPTGNEGIAGAAQPTGSTAAVQGVAAPVPQVPIE